MLKELARVVVQVQEKAFLAMKEMGRAWRKT